MSNLNRLPIILLWLCSLLVTVGATSNYYATQIRIRDNRIKNLEERLSDVKSHSTTWQKLATGAYNE